MEKQHQQESNRLNQEIQQARTQHNTLQSQYDKVCSTYTAQHAVLIRAINFTFGQIYIYSVFVSKWEQVSIWKVLKFECSFVTACYFFHFDWPMQPVTLSLFSPSLSFSSGSCSMCSTGQCTNVTSLASAAISLSHTLFFPTLSFSPFSSLPLGFLTEGPWVKVSVVLSVWYLSLAIHL